MEAEPAFAVGTAKSQRVGHGLRRYEFRCRYRTPVAASDPQCLTPDECPIRIDTALALHIGERPDRRRLAPPPAGLPTNSRALRRDTAVDVSPTRRVAPAVGDGRPPRGGEELRGGDVGRRRRLG